jgi:hypothetical protein
MPSQIFKLPPDMNVFKSFLDDVSDIENDRYVISMAAFKRSEMFDHMTTFCDYLEECYYDSKKFYVRRRMTYKNFITVIRQVCKVSDLAYTTQTRYYKSSYEMVYIINRFNRPPVDDVNGGNDVGTGTM